MYVHACYFEKGFHAVELCSHVVCNAISLFVCACVGLIPAMEAYSIPQRSPQKRYLCFCEEANLTPLLASENVL